MRKILSLILVAAMFVSMLMLPTGTSAAAVLEENVEAKANYFSGSLSYLPSEDDVEAVPIKEGGANTLTIDGHIDEGEWGNNVIHIDSKYAANNQNAVGKWMKDMKNDAMYGHPSAENTYFYQSPDNTNPADLSYDLYLLWDEDYLYLAARVDDPGRHQSGNTGLAPDGFPLFWQGDALQFMIDTEGPNSASAAAGQTYKYFAEHNIIHNKTETQDIITYANRPWEGTVTKEGTGEAKYLPVPNFVVTYNRAEGAATCSDSAPRYNPHIDEAKPEDGTKWDWERINNGGDIGYDTMSGYWYERGIASYISAKAVNTGTRDNPDYITDYEVAIPWEMITRTNEDGTFQETFAPQIGSELGMSLVVLNSSPSTSAADKYESWLGWGSGICNSQTYYDYQTAGGSNLVTLTGTDYKEDPGCEHTFAAATCIAPETCTKCGYERGFETGHKFVCSDDVLPTETSEGSATATCATCGTVEELRFSGGKAALIQSFSETDEAISEKFSSGWSANWYDIEDDPNTQGHEGKMLYYLDTDGKYKAKTAFDKTTFGYAVADCATEGRGLYYADGTEAVVQDDLTFTDQTGTYFDSDSINLSAYTYKLDVYPTDYTVAGPADLNYVKGLYNWFGRKAADYMAGLFVFDTADGNQRYIFAIASTDVCNSRKNDIDAFIANCEVYREVDHSVVAENQWHEQVFFYDDDAQYAAVYWDGELMVSAHNSLFKYLTSLSEGSRYAIYRRMDIPFYAKNIQVGESGLASTFVGGTQSYTATVNGEAATYSEGATVNLTATNGSFYKNEGRAYRFAGWVAEGVEIADAKNPETTFTMPANDVTVNESYIVIGDLNLDGKINATDANLMKRMITGGIAQTNAADINNDGKVNAQDANNLKAMVLGQYSPIK